MRYTIRGNLRQCNPYFHSHKFYVKGRWVGMTVLDVFCNEFRSRSEEYYRSNIDNGTIKLIRNKGLIAEQTIDKSLLYTTLIRSGDCIVNTEHKHEPEVGIGEEIVYQDDNILVVNKPGGIPVHPTGKYYYNTMTEIIRNEMGVSSLYPCHRLDRLTSGILIIGKTPHAAAKYQAQMKQNCIQKTYVARVNGEFPLGNIVCSDKIVNIDCKRGYQNGITEPKEALTSFQRLAYSTSSNQSIVKCSPKTGRTHQIRIHLRNLGHPIANDPLYGFNELLGIRRESPCGTLSEESFEQVVQLARKKRDESKSADTCPKCGINLYRQRNPEELGIWLHALSYRSIDWKFHTQYPPWAKLQA
ncbi:BA75_02370T0 [Komagataella pastoris]|uniref:Pseudouridine synthase n=1 Tax=Komagataella pastoris TaxID=4922 RepID=A0A1B2JAS7_PICPA|nr:BA75_02370T0 [Komagataella pastoris]